MSELKVGDSFPEGVVFTYVPPAPETKEVTQCGIPVKYDASKEFKNKKIVLVAVPGAFTPTCQEKHVVTYTKHWNALKEKGVDHVVFISMNDAWVMSAWGKSNDVHDDTILFMADDDIAFSKQIGWVNGNRPLRYAFVIDHGKVTYAERDTVRGSVENTGAEGVLSKL